MYKNIKVILIGGSPMTGKSTLAARLSALYGYSHISTDDIGEILQTAQDINPMKGCDYREYYIQKSYEELVNEAYEYHNKIIPAIERLITIHSDWSNPIIIEGWALYPDMLKHIASDNIKKIWLVWDEKVLKTRLEGNRSFYSGVSDEEAMKLKYLKRSIWHNDKIRNECVASGDNFIHIEDKMDINELIQKILY